MKSCRHVGTQCNDQQATSGLRHKMRITWVWDPSQQLWIIIKAWPHQNCDSHYAQTTDVATWLCDWRAIKQRPHFHLQRRFHVRSIRLLCYSYDSEIIVDHHILAYLSLFTLLTRHIYTCYFHEYICIYLTPTYLNNKHLSCSSFITVRPTYHIHANITDTKAFMLSIKTLDINERTCVSQTRLFITDTPMCWTTHKPRPQAHLLWA